MDAEHQKDAAYDVFISHRSLYKPWVETLANLLRTLDALGYSATPEQVQRSLERLQLAYVIQQEKEQYRYCVPLFRDWVLAREPQDLLRRELAI